MPRPEPLGVEEDKGVADQLLMAAKDEFAGVVVEDWQIDTDFEGLAGVNIVEAIGSAGVFIEDDLEVGAGR